MHKKVQNCIENKHNTERAKEWNGRCLHNLKTILLSALISRVEIIIIINILVLTLFCCSCVVLVGIEIEKGVLF
jgi:hypothetical protein